MFLSCDWHVLILILLQSMKRKKNLLVECGGPVIRLCLIFCCLFTAVWYADRSVQWLQWLRGVEGGWWGMKWVYPPLQPTRWHRAWILWGPGCTLEIWHEIWHIFGWRKDNAIVYFFLILVKLSVIGSKTKQERTPYTVLTLAAVQCNGIHIVFSWQFLELCTFSWCKFLFCV